MSLRHHRAVHHAMHRRGPPWLRHRRRGSGPHGPHGKRLFWRVYLHGIFLLVAVLLSVSAVGWFLGRGSSSWQRAERYWGTLEAGGPALLADRARMDELVLRAGEAANMDLSVYRPGGELVASNIEPPLPPVDPQVAAALGRQGRRQGRHLVMPVFEGKEVAAYVVAEWRGPGLRMISRGIGFLLAVMFALAVASVPLVRTIVAPLERLTGAVRAFGDGDLSVRSGFRRRDEVGELAQAFDEMAERLERLVRNERELLANVSHELRTPLSRIRVALELAAEGNPEKAQRYLREIGSDLAELEQLVEDVLTAARLDSPSKAGEGFPLHRTPTPLSELLDSAVRRFREAWPERTLHAEHPPTLPTLEADPVLLRRVVDNLLDNARKYSDDGKPVRLRAVHAEGEVRIEVRDEGIGLTSEDLAQLFTPFFRSDRSRQRGTGGVGLGLALARRIVEAHGGALSAQSEPGQGSVFSVVLPLAAAATAPDNAPGAGPDGARDPFW